MLFTDHKVCLKQNKELVEKEIKKIKEIQGITILSVGIGSHIDIRELKEINSDERKVMRFGEYTNREIVGKSISHGMLLFGLIQLGGQRRQGVSLTLFRLGGGFSNPLSGKIVITPTPKEL